MGCYPSYGCEGVIKWPKIAGSHYVMTHPHDPRRTVTVPVHGNHELKRGTLRSIIRQSGFSVEQFRKLL